MLSNPAPWDWLFRNYYREGEPPSNLTAQSRKALFKIEHIPNAVTGYAIFVVDKAKLYHHAEDDCHFC